VVGQTCCSGGVPLSTNLGFVSDDQNTLHLALSGDYNQLSTLYNEDEVLAQNNRKRSTSSYFFRVGYDFAHGWATELLVPFIFQERSITQNNGLDDLQRSTGIGDVAFLVRKNIFVKPFSLDISAGLKLPTGSTSEVNNNGLLLVNDMQPGSGSVDGLFLISSTFPIRGSLEMYTTANYQWKGIDDDYLGSLSYGFGDELQISSGVSDQVLVGGQIFAPSVGLRYRSRSRDEIDNFSQENTGGRWMFAQLGVGWLPDQLSSISIKIDVPLWTRIDGTQLSNDYIFNMTIYRKFKY